MNYTLTLIQTRPLLFKKRRFLKIFFYTNLIFFITICIFTIFQMGALLQKIYLFSEYEKKIEKLSKENKILEISFSQLNSLSHIEDYLIKENFVKTEPNKVKYIQVFEDTIATK